MRILIADRVADSVITSLEAAGCEVTSEPTLKDGALQQALSDIQPDTLVVRSTKVHDNHIEAGDKLALIIRGGAGVNNIDLESASVRGIYVANCPGKNAIAVAELVMGHLINLDRQISDNVESLRAHKWEKKRFSKGKGLYGRSIAVLGTGRIGQEVIRRAQAFGMNVRGWDIALDQETADAWGIQFCDTPLDACRDADAVTVHLPLTDNTRGLIDAPVLNALAPGGYVINTSRGGIVDEAALMQAANDRGIRAGLDVYANEPAANADRFEDAIADSTSVYGTHHIGASTAQASEAVGDEIVRIVRNYIATGEVLNCVNLAKQSPATHLLVLRHLDKVGVLATVLDLLRTANINVQEMENIIFRGASAACARIQMDSAPSKDLVDKIQSSSNIISISVVSI